MPKPPTIFGTIVIANGLAANLPATGVIGEPFYTTDTNTLYVWSGSSMVDVGGSGGGAFSTITAGTNTHALVIGSSGSLAVSGTGTIAATSVTGFSVTSGKTLTVDNSITLAGTDSTTMTFPSTSGTVVTLAATQTLTNKTLTSPTLTGPALGTPASGVLSSCTGLPLSTGVTGNLPVTNLNSGTSASSSTFWRGDGTWASASGSTGISGLTTGQIPIAGSSTTLTSSVAAPAGTIVGTTDTQTLTNKTLTSPTLTTPALGTPSSGTLTSCTFPTLNQNTSGTAANLSGTPALPNGTTATTQTTGDNTTKLATTAFVIANAGGGGGSSAFSAITGSTNTSAAMVVGSGAALSATGTGAITATGLTNWFNVVQFGAVGNGSTDDTTAIQNAINAANTAGGGTVYFPCTGANYYKITSALKLYSGSGGTAVPYSNITLLGCGSSSIGGSVIGQVTTGDDILAGLNTVSAQSLNCSVIDIALVFEGGTLTNSGNGINLAQNANGGLPYQGWNFQNVTVQNVQGSGKYAFVAECLITSTIDNVQCQTCSGNFFLNGSGPGSGNYNSVSTSVTFIDCYTNMATNGVSGYIINDCTYVSLINCACDIGANSTGSAYLVQGSNNVTFEGCGFEGDGTHSITNGFEIGIDSGSNASVGCVLTGCYAFQSKSTKEFYVTGSNGSTATFIGCFSDSSVSGSTGLTVDTGASAVEINCNFAAAATARTISSTGNWQSCGSGSASTNASALDVVNGSSATEAMSMVSLRDTTGNSYTASNGFLFIDAVNSGDSAPLIKLSNAGSGADIAGTNFTFSKAGLLTKYDGITTAGMGTAPIIYSSAASTAFGTFNTGAAVTMLASSSPAGFYRVTFNLVVTTTFVTNTAVTLAFGWTDEQAARTLTLTGAALTAGTQLPAFSATALAPNSFTFYSTGAAAITYTPAKTGTSATAGAAWVAVALERLI